MNINFIILDTRDTYLLSLTTGCSRLTDDLFYVQEHLALQLLTSANSTNLARDFRLPVSYSGPAPNIPGKYSGSLEALPSQACLLAKTMTSE